MKKTSRDIYIWFIHNKFQFCRSKGESVAEWVLQLNNEPIISHTNQIKKNM